MYGVLLDWNGKERGTRTRKKRKANDDRKQGKRKLHIFQEGSVLHTHTKMFFGRISELGDHRGHNFYRDSSEALKILRPLEILGSGGGSPGCMQSRAHSLKGQAHENIYEQM